MHSRNTSLRGNRHRDSFFQMILRQPAVFLWMSWLELFDFWEGRKLPEARCVKHEAYSGAGIYVLAKGLWGWGWGYSLIFCGPFEEAILPC